MQKLNYGSKHKFEKKKKKHSTPPAIWKEVKDSSDAPAVVLMVKGM